MTYERLSERECAAIRCEMIVGYDHEQMLCLYKDKAGLLPIPPDEVWAYKQAWRRSGLWSLKGIEEPPHA